MDIKKIVLTTDLSSNADAASEYAVELAKKFGASIYLVHVFESDIYYAGTMESAAMNDPAEFFKHARDKRQLALKEAARTLAAATGLPVNDVFREGHAANEIVTFAKDENADCIVIATHGRSGLSHLIFGSVAEKVVRMSSCPVLSVRPKNVQG